MTPEQLAEATAAYEAVAPLFLRDLFAAAAISGLTRYCCSGTPPSEAEIASMCDIATRVADQQLKRRKEQPAP